MFFYHQIHGDFPMIHCCQELKRLQTFLTAARRSAALLARRRLGRIEALAAWLARQRDDGGLANRYTTPCETVCYGKSLQGGAPVR